MAWPSGALRERGRLVAEAGTQVDGGVSLSSPPKVPRETSEVEVPGGAPTDGGGHHEVDPIADHLLVAAQEWRQFVGGGQGCALMAVGDQQRGASVAIGA